MSITIRNILMNIGSIHLGRKCHKVLRVSRVAVIGKIYEKD